MSASLHSLMLETSPAAVARSGAGQFAAFVLIGASAALLYVGLSVIMVPAFGGVPAWIVSSLCYAGFIIPVYLAHRHFSFQSAVPHREAFPRYLAVQISAMGLATLFSYVGYSVLALPDAISATLVIVLTAGVNFVLLKLWAFARHG